MRTVRFVKTNQVFVVVAVVLIVLGLTGGNYLYNRSRIAPDRQTHYSVTAEADNATQQANYAGTGDGEDITATSSNKYICTTYKGSLADSPTTSNASAAISDINGPILTLYQSGQYSDAAEAATDAATHLEAARSYATTQVQLCYLVGLLKSGVSQMDSLASRLNQGQATSADLAASVHYASALIDAGL